MALHDISVPIREGMPIYRGNPGFEIHLDSALADGAGANVSKITMGAHTGTHMDGARHFFDDGAGTDALPLDAMLGRCEVVALPDVGLGPIDEAALRGAGIPAGTERVLLKTPNSQLWEQDEFTHDFARLDGSGARYALEIGLRLIGIDYLSIGDGDAHHELLGSGVVALEGLDLREIEPGPYELICLPLRLIGSDGAPVACRASRPRGGAMSPGAADGPLRGGIDLGGTKIEAIVIDSGHAVLGQSRRPTPHEGGPDGVAAGMAEAMAEAAEAAGTTTEKLSGVGVGSPGLIEAKSGVVSNAKNLPDWAGSFPMGARLADALGTKVAVGNDVSVAVRGEYELGAGRHHDSVLGVFWGTGVGGGLVLGGKEWHGRGSAGEIGHMVVERGGARCPCGNRGCMEAYAGRSAMEAEARKRVKHGEKTKLFKLMEEHKRPRLTSGIWERALDHDDAMAEELIDRAVKALGAGIASAVNLLDAEIVILGGGLGVRFGERLGPEIQKRMHKNLFDKNHPPEFAVAELGDLGGAIGASLLVS